MLLVFTQPYKLVGLINKVTGERDFALWDVIAVPKFKSDQEAKRDLVETVSEAAAVALANSPRRHHTIPTYLCGALNQERSQITHTQHVAIHTQIAGITLALAGAEEYANRVLGNKRLEVVTKNRSNE